MKIILKKNTLIKGITPDYKCTSIRCEWDTEFEVADKYFDTFNIRGTKPNGKFFQYRTYYYKLPHPTYAGLTISSIEWEIDDANETLVD